MYYNLVVLYLLTRYSIITKRLMNSEEIIVEWNIVKDIEIVDTYTI